MQIQFPNRHGEVLAGSYFLGEGAVCVVLCHGFKAFHREGIIWYTFEEVQKQNIPVFAFDFSGNGQSQGIWVEGDYSKGPADLKDALNYLERKYGFKKFVTVGHSMGGCTVLVEAQQDNRVIGIVTYAGVALPKFLVEQHPHRYYAGATFEVFPVKGYEIPQREYTLNENFVQSARKATPLNPFPSCPVFSIVASRDQRIGIEHTNALREKGAEILEVDADHLLLDAKEEIVAAVLEFFKNIS